MKTGKYPAELLRGNPHENDSICISIIVPLHKQLPDRNQNKLMIKNAIKEAKSMLRAKYQNNLINGLINDLDQLPDREIFATGSDGVGIFVSKNISKVVHFPFEVTKKVIVDYSFEIRDLIFAESQSQEYFVLVLDNNKTRLFKASGADMEEIINGSFPLSYEEQFQFPDRQKPGVSSSFGKEESTIQEERQKGFYRHLDKLLAPYFKNNTLPIVLLGIADQQTLFRKVTQYEEGIVASLNGNFAYFNSSEIAKKVWPEMTLQMQHKDNEIIARLEKLRLANKIVIGVIPVWEAANSKGNQMLVVEKDYHQTAYLNESSGTLSLDTQQGEGWDKVADLVDDIIELVISNKGKITFVDNGKLEKFEKIALMYS